MITKESSEKVCAWAREGKCWFYMPDSVTNCKCKCSNYWENKGAQQKS